MFLGRSELKLIVGKLAPERSDSTSSVDSRSSGVSGKGEGRSAKRKPQQSFSSKLAPVERSDSTSSVDSHGSVSKKEGKHSRKPQQVYTFSKKREEAEGGVFTFGQKTMEEEEADGEERGEGSGKEEHADSLSISVDWGALPSGMSISSGGSSLSNTPTTAPAGGGFTFPAKGKGEGKGKGKGKATSPTLVSLPLLYSAHAADAMDTASSVPPPSMLCQTPQKFAVSTGFVTPDPDTAYRTILALKKMRADKLAAREAEEAEEAEIDPYAPDRGDALPGCTFMLIPLLSQLALCGAWVLIDTFPFCFRFLSGL